MESSMRFPMLIDGKATGAEGNSWIRLTNPANGEIYGEVPAASAADGTRAIEIAFASRTKWAQTPAFARIEIFDRFLSMLESRREALAKLLTQETGKPIREARAEVETTYRIIRGYSERLVQALYGMATQLDVQAGLESDYMLTRQEPLGVVVGVLPFNYPAEMYAHKVAPALLTGNCMVVKPSIETPVTALTITEWLYEAGLPGSVLHCVTGRGQDVGAMLVSDSRVAAVSFTGSTSAGIDIYQRAAGHVAKVILELGGNDPLLVLEDADLALAAEAAVAGRTFCAGQSCCAPKRVIVDRRVASEFEALLVAKAETIQPGDPMDEATALGTVISLRAASQALEQVAFAKTEGARLAVGGTADGAFFMPTVLTGVEPTSAIATNDEVFAPVIPLIAAGTESEMVQIANNSDYGLNAGVFTRDMQHAFTLASQLECGLVVINGGGLYRPYIHQHGGVKLSGLGREGLDTTLGEMVENKGVVFRGVMRNT